MPPDRDKPDYEVGYGKPPKHTQFKKGQSGNPKGRPPCEKNLEKLLDQVLDEKIAVTENGRPRKIPKREAVLKQIVNSAVMGDTEALLDVARLMERLYSYHKKLGTKDPPLAAGPTATYILPHNGRDDLDILQPRELTRRILEVKRKWDIEQQQKQTPANDNDEDVVSKQRSA